MKKQVLLADDNESIRKSYSGILCVYGYEVTTAPDGRDAWEELHQHPNYDLIISDYSMPHLDGLSFLNMVRETPEFSSIPFLLTSGDTVSRDGKKLDVICGELNAHYIQKGTGALLGFLEEFPPDQ